MGVVWVEFVTTSIVYGYHFKDMHGGCYAERVMVPNGFSQPYQQQFSFLLGFLAVAADVNLVWPQVPVMVQLIIVVGSDEERSDSLVASAAGLLG